jgi:hypothetical protein
MRHKNYVRSITAGKNEVKAPPRKIKRLLFGASQEGYGKESHREVKVEWDKKEWRSAVY